MQNRKIKVMVVDDSVMVRKYVLQILSEIENIDVVATAENGKVGMQKYFIYKPDLIILDIEMPEMNGLEFLKYIKTNIPKENRPSVIMFSSLVHEGAHETFEALENGASEIIKKPDTGLDDSLENLKQEFDLKIKALYKTKAEEALAEASKPVESGALVGIKFFDEVLRVKPDLPEIIVVGSSTGGPAAIRNIMNTMVSIPVPMVIAQHIPSGFTAEFARNLVYLYKRDVRELVNGDTLMNGVIYVCPSGVHAHIERKKNNLVFRTDDNNYPGSFFKPSIDILFDSVKQSAGNKALGILLSGMGTDGSAGCVSLRSAGAITIAQDKSSSTIWEMPGTAVKSGGIDIVINSIDIGGLINRIFYQ